MTKTRGKFITVEGTEGVGKSTNIAFIRAKLEAAGIDLVVTREPGGTPLAEEIRELLLAKRSENVDPKTELLLIFAARAQHVAELIEPALSAGKWVLSDRFVDASFAYQGQGRQLGNAFISPLADLVLGGLKPDCTFLLDIDVELGLQRAKSRAELDRFEEEEIAFFERVRKGYQLRVTEEPERFCIVDGSQSLERVQQDIDRKLKLLLDEFLNA